MTEHKPIEFYFEFASPYGYFASTKIDGIAAKYGRNVKLETNNAGCCASGDWQSA